MSGSNKLSEIFYKDFKPDSKGSVKKEKAEYQKMLGKDRKKNKKYRRKEQFISSVDH